MNQQMDKQLPEGWETTQLAEVADIILGQSPDGKTVNSEGKGIVFYQGKAEFGLLHPTPRNYCTNPKKIAKENDILLSVRAPVGPTNLANQETAIGRGLAAIRETQITNFKFILFYFRNIEQWLSQQGTGTTFQAISGQFIRDLPFPLPPLAEQHYLADKLDSLLARIQTLSDQLAAVPALLKQFRQSVLADAVSGRLLNRGKNSNGWEEVKFGDVITSSGNGISKRKSDTGMDTTVLRLADFKDAERITGNERQIQLSQKEIEQYVLKENDLLVIRVNGSAELAGKFILYKDMGLPEAYCDHFIRFRIDKNKLLPRYFLYVANSGEGRAYLRSSLSTSAGQNTINQTSIKNLIFKLPPLAEQTEIVRRVETLFALADDIEQQSRAAAERVVLLTQSVLAKAFRGELSEQWRREHPDLISGDNSAAALLARIQAERAATGKKSRRA